MATLQKNVAGQHFTFVLVNSTTGAGLAGATVTMYCSLDGAAQITCSGTTTSLGNGQYVYAPLQSETNATDVGFMAVASSAVPSALDFHTDVVDANGLVQVDVADWNGTAVGGNLPTNFSSLTISAGGRVSLTDNLQQNTALNGFMFTMLNSTTGLPQTGLTVTGQRSLGGASLGSCANAVTEVGNGIYTINLAAADLNAASVMLRFSATGALDTEVELITTP